MYSNKHKMELYTLDLDYCLPLDSFHSHDVFTLKKLAAGSRHSLHCFIQNKNNRLKVKIMRNKPTSKAKRVLNMVLN
jgi:hypothetical protein